MIWCLPQRFLAFIMALVLSPILFVSAILTFLYDRKNPFYTPIRMGKDGKRFKMIKLRTMIIDADKCNIVATASNDKRLTYIGKLWRCCKLDELFQLFNVIKGEMMLIGPRPQLISEFNSFTEKEKLIVTVYPGISDFASLFLSNMEKFLAKYADPYEAYHSLCRPIKSRLAIFYVKHRSFSLDVKLLFYNFTNFISHRWTLEKMANTIHKMGDCGVNLNILSGKQAPYPMDLP